MGRRGWVGGGGCRWVVLFPFPFFCAGIQRLWVGLGVSSNGWMSKWMDEHIYAAFLLDRLFCLSYRFLLWFCWSERGEHRTVYDE